MNYRFAMVLFAMLALTGCATAVNVDFDKTTNFTQLRTYLIDPVPDVGTRDTRWNSPLVNQRIIRVAGYMLDSKGFVQKSENPDFRVVYRIDTAQEQRQSQSGFTIGVGSFGRHSSVGTAFNVPTCDVQTIDRGVLTIDIVSARTGALVWRGSSSRRIFNGSTPEAKDTLVFEIVTEILEKFPPIPKLP